MKKSILALTLASVTLIGCGDSHVQLVKNSYTDLDETLTLGQVLDNRSVCAKVDWTKFEDDKDRTVVEYRCHLKGAKDYSDSLRDGQISRAESSYNNRIEHAKIIYDRKHKSITYLLQKLKKQQESRAKLEAELPEAQAAYEEYRADYKAGKKGTRTMNGGPLMSDPTILYQKRLKWSDEAITRTRNEIPDEVHVEDTYNASLDSALEYKNAMLQEAEDKYSFSDVYEIFQWSFNKNSEPTPIYTGMVVVKNDGKELSQSLKFQTAFSYAYENNIQSIVQHLPIKIYLSNGLGLRD